MKKIIVSSICLLLAGFVFAQKENKDAEQTLLWKISGNGLKAPSYLFGTIHMICSSDALLSNNLKQAIKDADEVYLEIDLNDLIGIMNSVSKMKMNNDTTLADLLSSADYKKVKEFFESNSSLLPFSILESFKPFLSASTMAQKDIPCNESISMDQVVMQEAQENGKNIKGLESVTDQLEVFDKIPYKLQAALLVQYIDSFLLGKDNSLEYVELMNSYKNQDLAKFEELTKKVEFGLEDFTDLILFDRNRKWVEKLKELLYQNKLVIAVGAGHLPGENGLIKLLRKVGFIVSPVDNKIKVTVI